MAARKHRRSSPAQTLGLVAAALVLGVVFAYADVRHHAFVDFDDIEYVVDNPHLDGRLSGRDFLQAFAPYNSNWAPLTSVSLLSSDALHGPDPGAYASTNVALHAAAAVFLLLALSRATGRLAPSAFVAAVFALHPLHVESVAWISERKEVLAGFFWMAALAAHPRAARTGRLAHHALVFALGIGALLSKATAVALPITLLLLDFWPLGRLTDAASLRRALLEKLPLTLAAAAVAVVTLVVQTRGGANWSERTALPLRLLNAGRAYVQYVVDTFWPTGLAYFYPYPSDEVLRSPGTWAATLLVGAATLASLAALRRRPLLAVGWLWFVLVLVPMIGLVRVGGQGHADRYVYVAQTGLVLMLAFGVCDGLDARIHDPAMRRACARALQVVGLVVVVALALATRRQVGVWRDSQTLFGHAIAVSPDNAHAHRFLGVTLWTQGERERGLHHLAEATRLRPTWGEARLVHATALLQLGRLDEAAREIERAAGDEADPGLVFAARGVVADRRGQSGLAAQAYQSALEHGSNDWEVLNNLAWIRATSEDPALRDPDQAIELAVRATALRPDQAYAHGTLAAAYASAGRIPDALAAQERAIGLLRRAGDAEALARFERRLEDYRSGERP